jgi:hypothetical protein
MSESLMALLFSLHLSKRVSYILQLKCGMYIISVFLCMVWVEGVAERPVKEHSSFTSDPAATDTSTTRSKLLFCLV